MTRYSKLLRDPRWQKLKNTVLERDEYRCCACGDQESELHVHHGYYEHGRSPWDYESESLWTLCRACHGEAEVNRKRMIRLLGFVSPRLLVSDSMEGVARRYYARQFERAIGA